MGVKKPPLFWRRPNATRPGLGVSRAFPRDDDPGLGVGGMAMRSMRVMCRLLVIASLVLFCGFAMMLRSPLVVLRGLVVVLDAMRAHFLPAGG